MANSKMFNINNLISEDYSDSYTYVQYLMFYKKRNLLLTDSQVSNQIQLNHSIINAIFNFQKSIV